MERQHVIRQPLRVWFVTPAWKRLAVTDVALLQRSDLRKKLKRKGIELRSVVVADDDNLKLAAEHGFDALERGNGCLGRKVNDGICHALEAGADFVAVVDSDSWVHDELLAAHDWDSDAIHTSNNFATLTRDGKRLLFYDVRHPFGLGPMFFPRSVLEAVAGRPSAEPLKRGLSTSMWTNVLDANRGRLRWQFVNVHDVQYVGLQSELQITRADDVARLWPVAGNRRQDEHPFAALGRKYPKHVVAAAAGLYGLHGAHGGNVVSPVPSIPADRVAVTYTGAGGRYYRGRDEGRELVLAVGETAGVSPETAARLEHDFPGWFGGEERKAAAGR